MEGSIGRRAFGEEVQVFPQRRRLAERRIE